MRIAPAANRMTRRRQSERENLLRLGAITHGISLGVGCARRRRLFLATVVFFCSSMRTERVFQPPDCTLLSKHRNDKKIWRSLDAFLDEGQSRCWTCDLGRGLRQRDERSGTSYVLLFFCEMMMFS